MADDSSSILLLADPGAPASIAERLSDTLPRALANMVGAEDEWDVSVRHHAYPISEDDAVSDVVDVLDLDVDDDVVIYLTDQPRRDGTTPVIADISVPDRLGVISIPGMGGLFIDRRVRKLAKTVVAEVSREGGERGAPMMRMTRTQDDDDLVRYLAPSAFSRLRLLTGMVYANRPWRLTLGMSKVLMAAFATGAVSLAYPTMWQLSDTMGPWRLSAVTLLATAALITWLIVEHDLWERPASDVERERAVLYNASTVVTLTIGVVIFHAGLFVLLLVTAWWTIPPQMVSQNIGHPVGPSTLFLMAWLVAGVATLGGALGSGMEDDEAVKAATYGARQRKRFS